MPPTLQHLGHCIYKARKEQALTQKQLSSLCGISIRHLTNIEKGKMNPTYEVLCHLISRLNIPADMLFNPDLSEREKRVKSLLACFSTCNDADQEFILKIVRSMVHEFRYRQPPETYEEGGF